MSKIEFFPGKDMRPNNEAIIHRSLESAPTAESVLVAWIDETGTLNWATNMQNVEVVWIANRLIYNVNKDVDLQQQQNW